MLIAGEAACCVLPKARNPQAELGHAVLIYSCLSTGESALLVWPEDGEAGMGVQGCEYAP